MKSYKIEFEICLEDFEKTLGRKAENDDEFHEFCRYCERGLYNGHIIWDIVFDCAKDAMKR